jgi:hypothetical protein
MMAGMDGWGIVALATVERAFVGHFLNERFVCGAGAVGGTPCILISQYTSLLSQEESMAEEQKA